MAGLVGRGWGVAQYFLPNIAGEGEGSLATLNNSLTYNLLPFIPTDTEIPSPYTLYNINSLYFDEQSISLTYSNSKQPLFLSLNTQSLLSKHESIKTFLFLLSKNGISIDILALQETWRIFYPELIEIPGYTFIHQHRTNNRGGGVGFYIKKGITYKINTELSYFTDNLFESLTIEAKIGNKNYLLSTVYRSTTPPPNTTHSEHTTQFITQLDTLLISSHRLKLNSYIFLDANINLLNLNTDHTTSTYHDTILNNGYVQLITKATRIQNGHYSLIDHILTNTPNINTQSGIIISDISDHFFTFTLPCHTKQPTTPHLNTFRNLSKTNIDNFKISLRAHNWATTFASNSATESFDLFWLDFHQYFNSHFPKITSNSNKNSNRLKNFLTPELLDSRKTKLKLHKLSISNPTPTNILIYRTHRNLYNTSVRQARATYYENNLANSVKDPKKTWQILKEAANLSSTNTAITEISNNGITTSDNTEIANSLNDFFSSVGTKISDSIPHSNIDPLSYCNDYPDIPHLDLAGTGPCQVGNTIKMLVSKSSTDLDGISSKLLKAIRSEIEAPLAHIFNLSLTTGIFPHKLKTSKVIPIHKAGDHTNCDNYRPITIVNAFSKILEKIVYYKLTHHLEINKLIHEHQYGFQRNRSTEHALLQILNTISTALNDKKYCVGIFLDLKKAFDTVPHDILLKKLEKLGITNTALLWFKSYLSIRTQKVEVYGTLSDSKELNMSVFQGTGLGPTLFLCYINDLPNASDLHSIPFADDTTGLDSDLNLPALMLRIRTELSKLALWFQANKMSLNVKKTKYIIFHVPSKPVDSNLTLEIDENLPGNVHDPNLITTVERIHSKHPDYNSQAFKLLGIYLDEHLNFNYNTAKLSSKLSRACFFLNRTKHVLSPKALKTLYTSFFHSHLLYCTNIYSCTSQANITSLFKQQKKAIRIISGSQYLDHTAPLFKKLGILPLESIITQAKATFMHSIYYEYAPPSFTNTWTTQAQLHPELNLRNANDFYLPFPRIELYKKLPLYSLPLAWNNLGDLCFQHNRYTFRTAHYNSLQPPEPPEA